MIDYTLSTVPPGHPEVSFMSDHLPLRLNLLDHDRFRRHTAQCR